MCSSRFVQGGEIDFIVVRCVADVASTGGRGRAIGYINDCPCLHAQRIHAGAVSRVMLLNNEWVLLL